MHLCSSSFMWIFAENFQHSTNKHYTSSGHFTKHGEKLPIFRNSRFPNFSANLWLWIPCCFGPYTWPSLGLPVMEKYFDIINFFRRFSLFSLPLPCFLQGVLSQVDKGPCLYYESFAVGHPLKTPEEHDEAQWLSGPVCLVPDS